MVQDTDQYGTGPQSSNIRDTDQYGTRPSSRNKVTVYEAAEILGVTVDAIRKRIQRETIPHERHEDGRVYVLLDEASTLQDNGRGASSKVQDEGPGQYRTERDELVDTLQDQVSYLKAEVEAWREESRRKDHLLAAALERVPPALEEARETPSKSSGSASEGEGGVETIPDQKQRSWLHRFFFGP
jgi:hypothetical protein